MIVIVDYGMGNLRSVQSKLEMLKRSAVISSDPSVIAKATHLILPGVGFFAEGMRHLRESGLIEALNQKVIGEKTPILGICLGMQLLTSHSEEGDSEGLKWIPGRTRRFEFSKLPAPLRIPHVGWNKLVLKRSSALFQDVPTDKRYYFTHSYAVQCDSDDYVIATTDYGYPFASVIAKGNVYGTQFHPEKSHRHGLQLIENFLRHA